MNYSGKKVLVCGMGKSGQSAALLLRKLGAIVTVQDLKEREKVEETASFLEENGIKLYLGKNPDDIVSEFNLIIASPGIDCDLPFFDKAFNACVPVWGEIELAYSVCKNPILAITGTNGKTTTTALLGEIMAEFAPGSEAVGNIGTAFTDKVLNLPKDAFAVLELSSFQLETAFSFHPRVAAVLNITPDHLIRHKTFENYVAIKERIFARQQASDYLVLNYDDPYCCEMAERARSISFFISRKEELDEGVFVKNRGIYVKWGQLDEEIIKISELKIPGNHNVENAMAASACAICAGVPLKFIRKALKHFQGVEHRIEFVKTLDGVDYFNDSKATNPDSAIKALEAMYRPVVLIGGGYDKDVGFGDWVKLFENKVKHLILIGATADKIAELCKQYNFPNFDKVNSLKDAVELSRTKAIEGDVVLLSPACASYDMFDNFEQRGAIFKDFVRNLK